ncbi:MAG: cell wall metabolism sensor histidine kinase WalK [Chitinophagales bacterium]|nr:cell wall metabolism sensor histidine kinase WalK [Chitinophagales bacterium]MCZ2393881.1 cell wall metabolism sensor histidine kinase WalK [Chitinophagales bacterium]
MIRRQLTPNVIAIITSFFVSILSSLALLLFDIAVGITQPLSFFFFQFALVFLISFGLYKYTLMRFVNDKLKIIYKAIGQSLKFQKEISHSHSSNIMRLVEIDVGDWAINKNKQIRELRKLETYRKEFVGNVSHELRTPIFNAQGYLETLLDGVDDPVIEKQYLQKALANVERLDAIVSDLLEISKFEAGQIHLEKKSFDIIALIKKIFYQYQHLAEMSQAHLTVDSKMKVLYVWADPVRITQVLENLVSNAIKYGKKGGTVSINFYLLDDQIIVEVNDDGPGIAAEHLHRLFERFFRADKSRSRNIGGTGLGLSIVKNIIEAHDQNITVRSELGVGTTFTFTLEKAKQEAIDQLNIL